MTSASDTGLFIRRATPADAPALSHICLFTADAGVSAEPLHTIKELPGLVYALPYVNVPYTAGFVLVHRDEPIAQATELAESSKEEKVVGYILFTLDTRAFEAAAERDWYPPLRSKYPLPGEKEYDPPLTDNDRHYIGLIHAPDTAPNACVAFSPAHMHIDILPDFQRKGWGRHLINAAVKYLRDDTGLKGVWLGMDPKNKDAATFYGRLGYQRIEGAPDNFVCLSF